MTALVSHFGISTRPTFSESSPAFSFIQPTRLMGIEIEVEHLADAVLPDRDSLTYWHVKADGSLLRGQEYVLRNPERGASLSAAIEDIFRTGRFYPAATSSTHIHLDVRESKVTGDVLQVLFAMVYAMEPVLFEAGDPSRKWCGYTHSIRDLPNRVVSSIIGSYGEFSPSSFKDHAVSTSRYYGFNLAAIGKYGSIEFRYFPTCTSAEQLVGWVNLIQGFAKASEEIGRLPELVELMSTERGYNEIVETWFSEHAELFSSCLTYKEVKLALEEVINVAKGASLEFYQHDKEAVLSKHPYLKKIMKKSRKNPTTSSGEEIYERVAPSTVGGVGGGVTTYLTEAHIQAIRSASRQAAALRIGGV